MGKNSFKGRSLTVIADFSLEERLYLFEKTRELKSLLREKNKEKLETFRINEGDFGVYEVFLESSTRTKESFRNASEFHRVKLSNLDVSASSINKKESYADTFNTLSGYDNSVFIVRSRLEGVCRWLEKNGREFAGRNGMDVPPSFINAGDGKHEHPTQELLDEFTFLEKLDWDRSSIHIALIGDLFHGRTVHSKVQGLNVFTSVTVDLVAPPQLALPDHYREEMEAKGYNVRVFCSIEEYLRQKEIAGIWYFTRPQLERMGDDILKIADSLRAMITFKREYEDKIPSGTVFYHPLPRHKEHPAIPAFLDSTGLNGWEEQSMNGRLVRIILLGLVSGKLGDDFKWELETPEEKEEAFIEEVPVGSSRTPKQYSEGVNPITNGIVIDHICRGDDEQEIREHMSRIIRVMKLFGKGGEWISSSKEKPGTMKGIIFRPGAEAPDESTIKRLAAIAPGATLNVIEVGKVVKKLRLSLPPRVYNLESMSCKNPDCISHPSHKENVLPEFTRISEDTLKCDYCEKVHTFREVWN